MESIEINFKGRKSFDTKEEMESFKESLGNRYLASYKVEYPDCEFYIVEFDDEFVDEQDEEVTLLKRNYGSLELTTASIMRNSKITCEEAVKIALRIDDVAVEELTRLSEDYGVINLYAASILRSGKLTVEEAIDEALRQNSSDYLFERVIELFSSEIEEEEALKAGDVLKKKIFEFIEYHKDSLNDRRIRQILKSMFVAWVYLVDTEVDKCDSDRLLYDMYNKVNENMKCDFKKFEDLLTGLLV